MIRRGEVRFPPDRFVQIRSNSSMTTTNTQHATLFKSLHDSKNPLRLSNAWDVASAKIAEAAGAPAIATTSAGIAWSLGVPDGDRLDRIQAVSAVRKIVDAVNIPVTADIEGGYARNSTDVADTISAIVEAGAVGINIEDGSRTPEDFAANIAVARRTAEAAGIRLFINARTDVFLAGAGSLDQMLEEVLARASRYVDAGADGIFVPGAATAESIGALTAGISVPVNIMVGPGSLSVDELGHLGVARVSLGSGVAQAAYAVAQRAANELMATGTYGATLNAIDYGSMNDLFTVVR